MTTISGKEFVHIRVIGWPITYNGEQFAPGSITAIPVRQAERLVRRKAAVYAAPDELDPGEAVGDGTPAPDAKDLPSSDGDPDAMTQALRTARKKAPPPDEDA